MKNIFFLTLAFLYCLAGTAQRVRYLVSFPNAAHHEANIQLVVRDIPKGPAIFRMSRSSPGRYATHEFGKNVYNVKALDANGNLLPIEKIEGDVYRVPKHTGLINITYTLYANYADGTYANVDVSSIHLNMPATFMWMKGIDQAPIEIFFDLPQGREWKIATQLKPLTNDRHFTAPGLQYFMDCPTKISELNITEWTVTNPDNKNYKFRIALEAKTTDSLARAFTEKVKKIVLQAKAVYGEVPAYDYGTYTFISSINPWVRGDGMEHRNSTMITIPAQFDGSDELLEVFAHEFFHCWNVERIRPKSLEPFDFEKSNMSGELWFAEGFTQYYGELLTERAGFTSIENYLPTLAAYINAKGVSPGGKFHTPIENSQKAVFVDAGVSIDRTNYPNIFTSYYYHGAAVALALDLELRNKFRITLDDFMQAVWKKFGKTEIPYTIPGLQQELEKLTNREFAASFFNSQIYGHESFDYKAALEKAGFMLKKANEGKAWIGNVRYTEGEALTISSNTISGTPLYDAGLDVDDRLISLDGKPIKKISDLNEFLLAHHPADKIEVVYKHRDETKSVSLIVGENPAMAVVVVENTGGTISQEQRAFREHWLGTKR